MKKCNLSNKMLKYANSPHFNSLLEVERFLEQITKVTQVYCVTKKVKKMCTKNPICLR